MKNEKLVITNLPMLGSSAVPEGTEKANPRWKDVDRLIDLVRKGSKSIPAEMTRKLIEEVQAGSTYSSCDGLVTVFWGRKLTEEEADDMRGRLIPEYLYTATKAASGMGYPCLAVREETGPRNKALKGVVLGEEVKNPKYARARMLEARVGQVDVLALAAAMGGKELNG